MRSRHHRVGGGPGDSTAQSGAPPDSIAPLPA
jgi:hypothetical protein